MIRFLRFSLTLVLSLTAGALLAQTSGPGTGTGTGSMPTNGLMETNGMGCETLNMVTQECDDNLAFQLTELTIATEFAKYRGIGLNRLRQQSGLTTRSDVTLSSQGTSSNLRGFTSLSYQTLDGNFDGNATSFMAGVDTPIGDTAILGGLLRFEQSTTDLPNNLTIERSGLMFGPYFAVQLNDTFTIDGFLAFGSLDYEIDGASLEGDRTIAGVTLAASLPTATAEFVPFVGLSQSKEKLPSYTGTTLGVVSASEITTRAATLGVTAYFQPFESGSTTIQPFGGLEFDFANYKDDVGNDVDFTTSRLKGGATLFLGNGTLDLGIDVAQASDGTTLYGGQIFYAFQF